jgi:bifunctional DNase/RNase
LYNGAIANWRTPVGLLVSQEGAEPMVEMSVESVRINLATNQRVVILKDGQGDRYLFIWIATAEAYSIAMELQGTTSLRPLTHDLLKTVIADLGGKLISVVINDLSDDIFYARLVLDANGRHVEVDSRPSDAIALAVRAKVPIYVEESVLDHAGVTLQSQVEAEEATPGAGDTGEQNDNLDVYRDFINSLDVLDEFGKPD